ncbi:MAG: DUF1641 domain-containing protein, partial [Proteobacteria bacterium]|nr:DUF1641 domain-containing protein [Pseudomonadota bacterium]
MTNEELILAKLENLETQIAPLVKTAKSMAELRDDMIPLSNQAFHILIKELQEVEAGFELDDLFLLVKQMLRSTRSFIFTLKQLRSMVDFIKDLEPLLKQSVPLMISYLDDLEQRGVFRIIKAMMDVRAKVAAAYTPEDIDQIGDGMVALLGLLKSVTDPQALAFLNKAAEIPATIDLSASKKIGPWGLLSAGYDPEVKQGLGVLIELTKAMGKLKGNGDLTASVEQQEST